VASLPELRAYNCQQCGVTVTEAESVATANFFSQSRRFSWISSWSYRLRGGDPAMDTQIPRKSGFADNFWVQMAALVLVTIAVIALAAKYIW
jgi:hypothetical protein